MSILGPNANKSTLLDLVNQDEVEPFYFKSFPAGHRPTDFPKWYNSSRPYTITWAQNFEPYVIVKLKDLLTFDERFIGFGFDKISFFMELDAMNYEMVVHPSAFVVHKPHATSNDNVQFHSDKTYRRCIQMLKKQFVKELAFKYSVDPNKY